MPISFSYTDLLAMSFAQRTIALHHARGLTKQAFAEACGTQAMLNGLLLMHAAHRSSTAALGL
jgi:hypothetical protein